MSLTPVKTIHNRGILGPKGWAEVAAAAEDISPFGIAQRPDLTTAAMRYLGLTTGLEPRNAKNFYASVAASLAVDCEPLWRQAVQFLVTGAVQSGSPKRQLQILRDYVHAAVADGGERVPNWLIEYVFLWGDQAMVGVLVTGLDERTLFTLARMSEDEYMRSIRDVRDFIGKTLQQRQDAWADVHPTMFWAMVRG